MQNERSNLTVTVAGSRNVTNCPKLAQRLAELRPAEVVSGGARGADALAAQWARANGVPLTEHLPDYAQYGSGATHRRNYDMAKAADVVLLLWDGASRGTLSTYRAAKALGRHVEWLMEGPPND